ncbi:DUF1294-domain-containing protein [Sporormia fimetaria CBS 119925]|uniref:DUF1294-domain-containing protein n=1 Tax=Sporormia fimetaria CBS 119925 TaxID=1340428 RepID=A0A6A6VMK6_9PLEO|nr:DUF1294-domain-containing protein [Sporormia fimetaria CBS 119925]
MKRQPSGYRRQRRRPITAATLVGAASWVLPVLVHLRIYNWTASVIPVLYTSAVSTVTFLVYGYDKRQAVNRGWRVKERWLHILGLLGGWPGAMLAQHYFQHKTQKKSFLIPFWGIVLVWQFVLWASWKR